jgi:hypothetical protein
VSQEFTQFSRRRIAYRRRLALYDGSLLGGEPFLHESVLVLIFGLNPGAREFVGHEVYYISTLPTPEAVERSTVYDGCRPVLAYPAYRALTDSVPLDLETERFRYLLEGNLFGLRQPVLDHCLNPVPLQ